MKMDNTSQIHKLMQIALKDDIYEGRANLWKSYASASTPFRLPVISAEEVIDNTLVSCKRVRETLALENDLVLQLVSLLTEATKNTGDLETVRRIASHIYIENKSSFVAPNRVHEYVEHVKRAKYNIEETFRPTLLSLVGVILIHAPSASDQGYEEYINEIRYLYPRIDILNRPDAWVESIEYILLQISQLRLDDTDNNDRLLGNIIGRVYLLI